MAECAYGLLQAAKEWLPTEALDLLVAGGLVSDGPYPETKAVIGGFSIIEVPTRDEALMWAAKIASSCRCAQEVREIMYDPES